MATDLVVVNFRRNHRRTHYVDGSPMNFCSVAITFISLHYQFDRSLTLKVEQFLGGHTLAISWRGSRPRNMRTTVAPVTTHRFRVDNRPLDRKGINEVAVVASRAFYTDPFFIFLSKESILRARGLMLFMRANLRHWKGGRIVTVRDENDRVVGAAAWLPTGVYPQSVGEQLAQTPGTIRALYRRPKALVHGLKFLSAIAKHHVNEPHWYLFLLIADPEVQRRGIGALLLNEALEQVDREGVSAYLETQKVENLAYYRRFGFELQNTITPIDGGPSLYAMVRPAR